MFRSDLYSKIVSAVNRSRYRTELPVGDEWKQYCIDWLSEEKYNLMKEKYNNMPKKKKKKIVKKKKKKAKKKKR